MLKSLKKEFTIFFYALSILFESPIFIEFYELFCCWGNAGKCSLGDGFGENKLIFKLSLQI